MKPTIFLLFILFTTFFSQRLDAQKEESNTQKNVPVIDSVTLLGEVIASARRRKEVVQDIPISITVISGKQAEDAGAFNINRLKELVPTIQLYASNAKNTTLNIRGLGSTYGLTNDGIDPGVGFYIDGVYHARAAVTALDFIDVNQIEILRGPQGTLFGKNTTNGAFNITTKKPTSTPGLNVELSYGNYNFIQAKTSVTGQLFKHLSSRTSFSGTQRSGTIFNEKENRYYNGLNNIGIKQQLYYTPTEKISFLLSGDFNSQRPDGQSLVVAGITSTLRSDYRQYNNIVKDLGYQQPVINPFSRKIDTNVPWKHNSEMGGLFLTIDYQIGKGTLTSTTAWRYWNWDPVNDRDFTQINALTKSQAPSRHDQWSQEFRYSGNITKQLFGTLGVYVLDQKLSTEPYQLEEVGTDLWRFQATNEKQADSLKLDNLINDYGIKTIFLLKTLSASIFTQIDWEIIKGVHLQPGLRFNYDEKSVDYQRTTYGGGTPKNINYQNLKNTVYNNQQFSVSTRNNNISLNLTISYRPNVKINTFITYATSYKPVGINFSGLPKTENGQPDLSLAIIKPEYVQHYELGIKTQFIKGLLANLSLFNTAIKDYQTNVQSPELGVNRGYLANASKVNVKGAELDISYQWDKMLTLNGALTYINGKYVAFTNAPLPLEETGKTIVDNNGKTIQQAFTDVSGSSLPGISKWLGTIGIELSTKGKFLGREGRFFIATDMFFRTAFSSNPTPSKVLNIEGYNLVNGRIGFKDAQFSFFFWSRNIANTNYFEQLQAAAGNTGLYAAVLGDPRTYGITLRYRFY